MNASPSNPPLIPSLLCRRNRGHQFLCYADSCSGVPNARHEATFAAVNAIVRRLSPQPEFICFPGDEISGLTSDASELRNQWKHWLVHEMSWLDRETIPLYHTTGNHTTYDAPSEAIFREMLPHLPWNGPLGQEGLAYFVRRGDLLMVFVNTASARLGGEGRVETEWLESTLAQHAGARHKLVFGHHPVFTVNGFGGAFQRDIEDENGRRFWQVLVRHGVLAYFCSHILAFDAQVHDGVLQIVTAGAGTEHRMPEGHEYLHCVQAAIDEDGLRYQVLDTEGVVREWLAWPPEEPADSGWLPLAAPHSQLEVAGTSGSEVTATTTFFFRVSGQTSPVAGSAPQTLLATRGHGAGLSPLWIGLTGSEQRLCVMLSPEKGRSPHTWHGPSLRGDAPFAFELALHAGMRPGGILYRESDRAPWSSLKCASPWGAERLKWPAECTVGHGQYGEADRPFTGVGLTIHWQSNVQLFSELFADRMPSRGAAIDANSSVRQSFGDIRPSTVEDVPIYFAIAKEAQRWLELRGLTQFVPAAHGEYAPKIQSMVESGTLFSVWRDDAPVGFFTATEQPSQWWPRDGKKAVYLSGMVVSEKLRGHGIGRAIIRWCVERAMRHGASAVRLDCHAGNRWLRSFYESEDFVLCGEIEQHPGYSGCLYERAINGAGNVSKGGTL